MRLAEYYGRTDDRSEFWAAYAFQSGFAPEKPLMDVAAPFLKPGKRLLDIGCQAGHQIALIRSKFEEAVGIDIADYGEMWKQFPDTDFRVHDVDAAPLPFPADHFDCVVCTNVLEHVFDVFGLAREISRVLRPRGAALISVPNVAFVRHHLTLLRGRVPRTGAQVFPFNEKEGWDGQHLHFFTRKELMMLLEGVGIHSVGTVHPGRLSWLKRAFPSLLDSGIAIIGEKLRSASV